jgi:hypothetical protein
MGPVRGTGGAAGRIAVPGLTRDLAPQAIGAAGRAVRAAPHLTVRSLSDVVPGQARDGEGWSRANCLACRPPVPRSATLPG